MELLDETPRALERNPIALMAYHLKRTHAHDDFDGMAHHLEHRQRESELAPRLKFFLFYSIMEVHRSPGKRAGAFSATQTKKNCKKHEIIFFAGEVCRLPPLFYELVKCKIDFEGSR